jgi:hypothetical protein
MLKIRGEQMEIFSRHMVKQFEDRMVVQIQSRYTEKLKNMPESAIRSMIQKGIRKAKVYNVTAEDDVQQFLEYMMIYGPEFDEDPKTKWARMILCTKDIDGTEKMELLGEHAELEKEGLV